MKGQTTVRWDNDTKMNLKEIGCAVVNWIKLAQKGSFYIDGNEPSGNFLSSLKAVIFPRTTVVYGVN